jgi:hypothetical protein
VTWSPDVVASEPSSPVVVTDAFWSSPSSERDSQATPLWFSSSRSALFVLDPPIDSKYSWAWSCVAKSAQSRSPAGRPGRFGGSPGSAGRPDPGFAGGRLDGLPLDPVPVEVPVPAWVEEPAVALPAVEEAVVEEPAVALVAAVDPDVDVLVVLEPVEVPLVEGHSDEPLVLPDVCAPAVDVVVHVPAPGTTDVPPPCA